jgi:enoyl-CoA hydratase/carnithine racemase
LHLERDGDVAIVTLDRPPVNAIDGELVDAVTSLAADLADDRGVGAVVWIGGGRMFSAGADLKAIDALVREGGAGAAGDLVDRMQAAFTAVAELPMPTIAASPFAATAIKRCVELAGTPAGYALERSATRDLYATDQVQQRLAAF